jgi:methionyl-tRNA formyltransferase
VTGVTTFKLKHEIDTGDILLQQKVAILRDDNAGTMHDKLMRAGAELLVTTVKGLAAGILNEVPQNIAAGREIKIAPKLFKEHLLIDWEKSAAEVNNFIRGLSPYPAAYTLLKGKQLKIYRTHYQVDYNNLQPGAYETDHHTYLRFVTRDGWIYIDELQLEGKKRMDIMSFLKGFRG